MTTDRIARYETLRARVRTTSSKGSRRLFVDRGTWGDQRGLRNREEVLAALVAHGFEAIYPEIAAKYDALLYPFFLDGIAGQARFNQRDGLHPLATGVDVIVAGILPRVEELLTRARNKRGP